MAYPTLSSFPVVSGAPSYHGTGTPTIWSPTILEKLWESFFLPDVTTGEFEGQIQGFGDNLVIRMEPDITTFDYADGQPIQYQMPTIPTVVLPIDKGRGWAFRLNKVTEQQMDLDMTPTWTTHAAKAIQKAVERSVLASIPAQCSAQTSGLTAGAEGNINLGEIGSPVTLTKTTLVDKIAECRTVLSELNVPREDTFILLPPAGIQRLVTSEFRQVYVTGDPQTMMRTGWKGTLFDFNVYESNLLPSAVDGGVTAYNCIFGWKRATAFAGTINENEMITSESFYGKLSRGLFIYGMKVVRDYAIGNLYCNFGNDAS